MYARAAVVLSQVCGPMGCSMVNGPPEAPEYDTQVGACGSVCFDFCKPAPE
jgi:hypothetical protein